MADIFIHYGKDMVNMTLELLKEANIAAHLRPTMRICIKPNLILSRPADDGATTHPDIVEGIIRYLQAAGCMNIAIAEGSWVGDSTEQAWRVCGYEALASRYNVQLIDTKKDKVLKFEFENLVLGVCESIRQADYLINVPVLKGHCQTSMTCCLKNMKGCIPDSEKRRYHTLGLHKPIAALNTVIKADLHIVDNICGDLSFEEGGNPLDSDRILLGFDPVLLDSYCAGLMGYHPDDIGYLRLARQYGVGEYADEQTEIVELRTEKRPQITPQRSRIAQKFAKQIQQDSACSACYASLIHALYKTDKGNMREKIKIGQGFKGKNSGGVGVGNCTAGCPHYLPGCPPKAVDIVEFLQSLH